MTDQPTAYTYEDAARLCGVSSETIRQRARRGKLRKGRPTNTNRPTVMLTQEEIEAVKSGRLLTVQPDVQPDGQTSTINALNGQVAALTGHVTTLREQLAKAEAATAAERQERIAAQAEAARLAADLVKLDKGEAERRARGLVARIRAAIRRD